MNEYSFIEEGMLEFLRLSGKKSIPRNALAWGLKRSKNPSKFDWMPEILSVTGHAIAPGGLPALAVTKGGSVIAVDAILRMVPREERPQIYRKIINGILTPQDVLTKYALKKGIDPYKIASFSYGMYPFK